MNVDDRYKYLRWKIQRCETIDSLRVIWAYSQYLQYKGFEFPLDIEKPDEFTKDSRADYLIHEWELEILAEETILHAKSGVHSMRNWNVLANCVQRLRELENEIYGAVEHSDVQIEMFRILNRQGPWQKNKPKLRDICRNYLIYSDSEISDACVRTLGLTIDQVYLLGILLYHEFASRAAVSIPRELFVEEFGGVFGRSLPELRGACERVGRLDHSYAYRVGALRRFPLVLISESRETIQMLCPIPTLLIWRITSGLYYDLYADSEYGNAFGKSFERYVGRVCSFCCLQKKFSLLGEVEYGTKNRPRRTPDWILVEEDVAALFVECKSKRITAAGKAALIDLSDLKEDVGVLADAVCQIYSRMLEYEKNQFPNLPFNRRLRCYPIVVTPEDWYIFGDSVHDLLDGCVEERLVSAGIGLDVIDRAPFAIVSADVFEFMAQIIVREGVTRCVGGKAKDASKRGWMFGDYLRDEFPEIWEGRRFIFQQEIDVMLRRVTSILTKDE